ncbi:MAG TPA: deoxyuridine 5'-triphosphate nucleotidohydrolase [Oribacterium sp.]|jgi:dUTP pyrophosphatase|nr:deoxyuridine 5'-triphosphate nucleotidohydrolase [Oribacterium sp.]
MNKTIRIKYHSNEIEKLTYIDGKSDWIDLRVAENVSLKKGEFRLISMGVSMQIPDGYEMLLAPRSSTFKNFGLIQTNSLGVIDESYCGDNDIIRMPVYATRDTELKVNDRIAQFRIIEHQPTITFEEVESLGNQDRGGFGSTGKN